MCDKAVANYLHALEFVPKYYKTKEMRSNGVNTHPSTIKFVPECYKAQEMCEKG